MADEKFIKVMKDGKFIEIHPSTLADHKRLGWVPVNEVPAAEVEPTTESEADKPRRQRSGRNIKAGDTTTKSDKE